MCAQNLMLCTLLATVVLTAAGDTEVGNPSCPGGPIRGHSQLQFNAGVQGMENADGTGEEEDEGSSDHHIAARTVAQGVQVAADMRHGGAGAADSTANSSAGHCHTMCAALDETIRSEGASLVENKVFSVASRSESVAGNVPAAPLKINRIVLVDQDPSITDMYREACAFGDQCIFFPPGDVASCGTSAVCNTPHTISGSCNAGTYTLSKETTGESVIDSVVRVDRQPGADCMTANSCLSGMLETTAYYICAGDHIEFSFKAEGGSDWFEAAVVLYRGEPGKGTIADRKFMRGSILSAYITDDFLISKGGEYYLGFYAATYDRTGGGALGAKMFMQSFVAKGACTACYVKAQDAGGVCEQFCRPTGCPCQMPWSQRCSLRSCVGCPRCVCGEPPPDLD